MPARTDVANSLLARAVRSGGLPPACRATPAFGSGQRAGTELCLQDELSRLKGQDKMRSAGQVGSQLYR